MKKIAEIIAATVPIMRDSLVTNKNQVQVIAEGFAKINKSVKHLTAGSGITQPPINVLSNSARYLIWWLTQIETDVCDQTDATLATYKQKTIRRADEQPTKECRKILGATSQSQLLNDFNELLKIPTTLKETEFKAYLDAAVEKIWILKQKIAHQVIDYGGSSDSAELTTTRTGA